MKLSDFKVITFDCYGTLIDWESGMVAALTYLVEETEMELTRNEILEMHSRHEAHIQLKTPAMLYSQVLARVYRQLADDLCVDVTEELCQEYGQSIKDWAPFEDSRDALQYLKQHFKLVILSNVDNLSFEASNKKLGVEFDAVYTSEDIGSYKPNDRNFEYMLSHLHDLGFDRAEILHTAESMFHDHTPANKFGIASCWIHRRHDQDGFGATMTPDEMPSYDFRFSNLADMIKTHKKEIEG